MGQWEGQGRETEREKDFFFKWQPRQFDLLLYRKCYNANQYMS